MNHLSAQVKRRLYHLFYEYRERRRNYKFCNFLPIIVEETEYDLLLF